MQKKKKNKKNKFADKNRKQYFLIFKKIQYVLKSPQCSKTKSN